MVILIVLSWLILWYGEVILLVLGQDLVLLVMGG